MTNGSVAGLWSMYSRRPTSATQLIRLGMAASSIPDGVAALTAADKILTGRSKGV